MAVCLQVAFKISVQQHLPAVTSSLRQLLSVQVQLCGRWVFALRAKGSGGKCALSHSKRAAFDVQSDLCPLLVVPESRLKP